jgi:hypothetical protein
LFDGLCEAGLPHTAVEIAREGFRKIGEPLCPFVALLCPLAITEAAALQDDDMPPVATLGFWKATGEVWPKTRSTRPRM